VTGVTINSAPVVNFSVTDAAGTPVVGLANYSQASTATVKALTNVNFTLAKLVPAANGEPSKWVSYNVTKFPTVAQQTAAPTVAWYGAFPQVDKEGTLVDNGGGSYTYTFARDPKQAAAIVAGLTDTTTALKADLGDVSFDANLTHRVGVIITGNAPGTGTNTPTAAASTAAAVAMALNGNATYDFIPATGKAVAATDASRDIVNINTCASCHDGKGIGHGTRRDPKLCVTCHTDQTKYGFVEATKTATGFSGSYMRIDGQAAFTFPRMIHQYHMGSRLTKTGYNLNGHCKLPGTIAGSILGSNVSACFNTVKLPQDVGNCTVCHDGAATGVKAAKDGDNWMKAPSIIACGSCHDGIDFKTGLGTAIGAKGKLVGGHMGGTAADSSMCAQCHKPADIAVFHTDSATRPVATVAARRTMTAAITNAAVATDGSGSVTVNFTVSDNGVAVTDPAAISGLAFTLAKLNPAVNGSSTHWESYTGKARTTVATNPPVVQGYAETALAANLTVDAATKVWTYKFLLLNATPAGDINHVDHVTNGTTLTTGNFTPALVPTLPNPVKYEPALTHRIGMEFNKGQPATGVTLAGNKFNAIYDWVPSGAKAQTRNIVSMDSCATCHAGGKIHKGYTTEYCVTCHNQNTYDPSTGTGNGVGTAVVDLQRIVHKLHMGNQLPSAIAGTPFTINGAGHDYSNVTYPGVIKDCAVCHSATATKADGKTLLEDAANWYTTPTKRACVTCHDGVAAAAHIDSQVSNGVETCVTCHGTSSTIGVDVKTVHR